MNARTPEEIGTLLEDALITRERVALAALFEPSAVLLGGGDPIRGPVDIASAALASWRNGRAYVAEPRTVVQAGDLALVVEATRLNVARRADGVWRYAIVLQQVLSE